MLNVALDRLLLFAFVMLVIATCLQNKFPIARQKLKNKTYKMSKKISCGDDLVGQLSEYIHNQHLLIASNIPDVCKEESCVLGVDEAGRGPVLGPMVYGITFCPKSKLEEFSMLGCADSKVLTEKKREDLFAILCACDDYVGWAVDIISPNFISNNMLKRTKHSLNEVAQDSTVGLIKNALSLGVKVEEIYVDTVGPPEKYQERLSKYFPDCKITVAKKADSLYPIVSGASICAKVCRDRTLVNWKFSEDIDLDGYSFGSGYPNDPETKKFLTAKIDAVFGFPNVVRFSWSTVTKLLENDSVAIEWEEDDENGGLKKYFKGSTGIVSHNTKHPFFKDNNLSAATYF